jgi:hypothetical protein
MFCVGMRFFVGNKHLEDVALTDLNSSNQQFPPSPLWLGEVSFKPSPRCVVMAVLGVYQSVEGCR